MENKIKVYDGTIIITGNIILNEQQIEALNKMILFFNNDKLNSFALKGYAGTGKTTVIRFFVQYVYLRYAKNNCYKNIVFATPTHRASFVLASSVKDEVRTLHSILGLSPSMNLEYFDAENIKFDFKQKKKLSNNDGLLIIDEASMINDELFGFINKVCKGLKIKVIYLGDLAQLRPVKQDTLSKTLTSTDDEYELTIVERTGSKELLDEITLVRNSMQNEPFSLNTIVKNKSGVLFTDDERTFEDHIISMFKSKMFYNDRLYGRVAVATNSRVMKLNGIIRELLYDNDNEYNIGEILMGYNTFGGSSFSGPEVVNSGDYELTYISELKEVNIYGIKAIGYDIILKDIPKNYKTGSLFILSRKNDQSVFDKLGEKFEYLRLKAIDSNSSLDWRDFYDFQSSFMTPISIKHENIIKIPKTLDYGYCCTTHKLQGGTYNVIFVDNKDINKHFGYSKELSRQLKYVAISRAKQLGIVLY